MFSVNFIAFLASIAGLGLFAWWISRPQKCSACGARADMEKHGYEGKHLHCQNCNACVSKRRDCKPVHVG